MRVRGGGGGGRVREGVREGGKGERGRGGERGREGGPREVFCIERCPHFRVKFMLKS